MVLRLIIFGVVFFLTPLLSIAQTTETIDYVVTELGSLGGGNTTPRRLNDFGHVVGWSDISNGRARAFLHVDGEMTNLGTLGGSDSNALSINNAGQIAGWARTSSGHQRGFLYQDGIMTQLGTLGGDTSLAMDLNDAGLVVGWTKLSNDARRAFLFDGTSMINLGSLPGGNSWAHAINDVDQIVGWSNASESYSPVFWSENGEMISLGTLGGSQAVPNAINNEGHVAGFSKISNGLRHAFFYNGTEMIDLETLGGSESKAWGINEVDQIVGWSTISNGRTRAFLWDSESGMVDINDVFPADNEIEFYEGWDINRHGQIALTGLTTSGTKKAYLLTHPSTDCDRNGKVDIYELDYDNDGLIDACDNCIEDANPGQEDSDSNGIGDVCEIEPIENPQTLLSMKDSFINNKKSNNNEGANQILSINSNGEHRALIAFDLDNVESERIIKATLVLTVSKKKKNLNPDLIGIDPIAENWEEGNGSQLKSDISFRGTGMGVTWNCAEDLEIANKTADCEKKWSGGSNFDNSATTIINFDEGTNRVSWDVTDDILQGATDGWIVSVSAEELSNSKGKGKMKKVKHNWIEFFSKEGASANENEELTPKLILEFE